MTKQPPDRRETGTFHSQAQGDPGPGGRFKRLTPMTITGAAGGPQYPAASSSHIDPVPPCEPIGIDINEMVPVGTVPEINASLGAPVVQSGVVQGDAATTEQGQLAASPSSCGEAQGSDSSLLPADVVETASPRPSNKKES